MGDATPVFVVDGVSKGFTDGRRPIQALQPVSFQLHAGEIVCLVGPSGSGKSTLLRIIGGLMRPTTTAVPVVRRPTADCAPNTAIGFVFQKTNLMPWRTVLQNVLLPLEIQQGRVTDADRARAHALLALMELEGFEHAYPRQLSGGMNQRVVLARTLMQQPRLLLMDEPFGQLDALTRERLNLELLRLQALHSKTILMVTHSINEAVFLSDRVLLMSERPGRIVAQVPVPLTCPARAIWPAWAARAFGGLAMQVRSLIGELSA